MILKWKLMQFWLEDWVEGVYGHISFAGATAIPGAFSSHTS